MAYLFDTNIFIRSKNEMPMDLWPTFWTKMAGLINSGVVFSSEMVKSEINRGNDELTEWIKSLAPKDFYLPITEDVIVKYEDCQNWARCRNFTQNALRTFAEVADAYLIATASAKNITLVTYETSDPNCKNRVKIPDVCNAIGVRYCDLNTVLRELGIKI